MIWPSCCRSLLTLVAATIQQQKLLTGGERVVIGVSGGADSVALVDLLVHIAQEYLPLSLALACLDHGLRPESQEEVDRVAKLAAGYGLNFFSDKVDLLGAGEQALEERARISRLRFLHHAADQFTAGKIALAHHADDQAETVLLHLLRGAGVQGLSGMQFSRSLGAEGAPVLIRPLLTVGKQQLLDYLVARKIEWCEDSSNRDLRFERNRLRHTILPFLRDQGYPQISPALCRLARRHRETNAYLQQQADDFWQRCRQNCCAARPELAPAFLRINGNHCAWQLRNADWAALAPALLPLVVRQIFAALGQPWIMLRESHYRSLQELAIQAGATIELPAMVLVCKNQTTTCFLKIPPRLSLPQKLDSPGIVALSHCCQLRSDWVETAQFDLAEYRRRASLLQPIIAVDSAVAPFVVRYSHSGDKIHALGAPGTRKVRRLLSDIGMPPPLRESVIVVSDATGQVLWLPGICIAESCRITAASQKLIQLSLVKR